MKRHILCIQYYITNLLIISSLSATYLHLGFDVLFYYQPQTVSQIGNPQVKQ